MKLWLKVTLSILLILMIAIAGIAVWQWNNIEALMHYKSNSQEDLALKLDENRKDLEKLLSEYAPNIGRDFTAEEERLILEGKLTPEEALERLKQENNSAQQQGGAQQPEGQGGTSGVSGQQASTNNGVDKIIGDYVAQLYGLKAYYLGQLGQVEAKAKAEYLALPKEQRNMMDAQKIASKYIGYAASLESQCDGQVNSLLEELKTQLQNNGGDTSIVKTIRESYNSEKSLKKAYYLSLLQE